MRRRALAWITLVVLLVCGAVPAEAGQMILGGPGGTEDPPDPAPDPDDDESGEDETQAQGGWNPTISCSAQPGDGILDLLACLAYGFENPRICPDSVVDGGSDGTQPVDVQEEGSPGQECVDPRDAEDFDVDLLPYPPPWGINVVRRDGGGDPHRIWLRENNAGIQTTELRLLQPGRVARIRQVEEDPVAAVGRDVTGSIFLTLNYRTVEIPTERLATADGVTHAILDAVSRAGFRVWTKGPFIVVEYDLLENKTLLQVRFRSTDPDIKGSDIGLVPLEEIIGLDNLDPLPN